MKLNGRKLPDLDSKAIIGEVLSGRKYTTQSLDVAKQSLQSAKRSKKRRKLI